MIARQVAAMTQMVTLMTAKVAVRARGEADGVSDPLAERGVGFHESS